MIIITQFDVYYLFGFYFLTKKKNKRLIENDGGGTINMR